MANNNIVRFVLDDEVLAAVGEMDETGAHDLLNAACEWYIQHKTPMTISDLRSESMEWLTRRWRHQQRKWREADERAPMIIIGWMEWLRQVA